MQTIISTRDGTWRTVEWEEQSQSWQTLDSGRVVVETEGEMPALHGAYLPWNRREPIVSRSDD